MAYSEAAGSAFILVACISGFIVAAWNAMWTLRIPVDGTRLASSDATGHEEKRLISSKSKAIEPKVLEEIRFISSTISDGANSFLFTEYKYLSVFMVIFSVLLLVLLGATPGGSWTFGAYTQLAFFVGSVTSICAGFIGMRIAVVANCRTSIQASEGLAPAFQTAFRAGSVLGFSLVSLGLLNLFLLIAIYRYVHYATFLTDPAVSHQLYEAIAGYGLGGSSVALFGRVGGGIYTKAADVGADLSGKVEKNLQEDDPRNPAVIADNVGDNVGDIAGMGSDLFGSFAESTCAALVLTSQSPDLFRDLSALMFPLMITATGIFVSIFTSFFASHVFKVRKMEQIERTLKGQLLISTVVMTPLLYVLATTALPATFDLTATRRGVHNYQIFYCAACGLWSGLVIGYITEYFTSGSYNPVREVARASNTGAATNIIYGLSLGYKSVIVPVCALAVSIYLSYHLAGSYGIAIAALGILSTLATALTIDAYGPICDNAGGIAEMAHMEDYVRTNTDALDSAGNTTAAIGKGFAIGSAAFVSLALFGAFTATVGLTIVDILSPLQFAGLLVGAMLPYWFSAMTIKAVGKAAMKMVEEVRRQFRSSDVLSGAVHPDYNACITIATDASIREMILPGMLVLLTPITIGFLFGVEALAGVLAGALVSGVQMAISAANTGGAWDNAKKYIEARKQQLSRTSADVDPTAILDAVPEEEKIETGLDKGADSLYTQLHHAAVIGDTVGDPLKDTSGPSLNILIKLMAITALVLAPAFPLQRDAGYIFRI